MASTPIKKRCYCRDPETHKLLGTRCPKLRLPKGSYNPNHGVWWYQLELPKAPGATRRYLRRGGFESHDVASAERHRAEALLALAAGDQSIAVQIGDLLFDLKANQPLPEATVVARRVNAGVPVAVDTTVADYLTRWLAGRRTIEPTTYHGYAGHIRNHLIPHLGHLPIDRLRVAHVQAMFEAITERTADIHAKRRSSDPAARSSVKGVKTTGPATMHRIRATLRKALNDAIRSHRLIEFNPAAHVELPSGKRPKARVWTAAAVRQWRADGTIPSPVMVWTPALAGQFLDYAHGHDIALYPLFALILRRGLRRGEAVGLPNSDVDLEERHITIRQQLTTANYKPYVKRLKSEDSDRTVVLDKDTVADLEEYESRKARWRQVNGSSWDTSHGLYFVRPDGKPWHPDLVSDRFEQLVRDADLPPVRLHDLRHGAASYAKAAGADLKDIQELLGHSSITITADTYTSVFTELEREQTTANAIADLIPRTNRKRAA